eukprot:2874316-Amphidinium_carterae.1
MLSLGVLGRWSQKAIEVWTRPEPCAAGSYCTEGTCPRYLQTAVTDIDFTADASATDVAADTTVRMRHRHSSETVLVQN